VWSVERIADYLGEWGVSVIRKDGAFTLRPPESLHREVFEHVAEIARAHIAPQRDAFITYIESNAAGAIPLYRNLPPAEKRRYDFRRVNNRAAFIHELYGWTCRVTGYSSYTLETDYLTDEHKAFPEHWTHANVLVDVPPWVAHSPGGCDKPEDVPPTWKIIDKHGGVVLAGRTPAGDWFVWLHAKELPHSRPPKGWKEYPNFRPPADWIPPPGWWDREAKRKAAQAKAERRAWWKRNWGHEGSLPD
jgi:hypothetical protein